MRRISATSLFLIVSIAALTLHLSDAGAQSRTKGRNPEKALLGKTRKIKTRETKVREPRAVMKAKKEQQKKEDKIKKDYNNYVADSRKRAFRIQTPEVQSRMKQNEKDIKSRDKTKKKNVERATRSGARKYRK